MAYHIAPHHNKTHLHTSFTTGAAAPQKLSPRKVPIMGIQGTHLSNQKRDPFCCLGFMLGMSHTTQLYRDYIKPFHKDPGF